MKGGSEHGRSAWAFAGLGMELAVTVAVGGGTGYWLDKWLGSGPWLTVLGAASGMVLAMYNLIRRANADDRDRDGDV